MNHVLVIDPGLDGVGCAVFDADQYSPTADTPGAIAAVGAWRASWTECGRPLNHAGDCEPPRPSGGMH